MDQEAYIVTFGEALLRLSPTVGELLREAKNLNVNVGGAEANVAAGLSSLGLKSRWFSRVNDAVTGDIVLAELNAAGVDTSFAVRAEARTGLYFVEHGDGVRPARVSYDRTGSAFAGIDVQDAEAALMDGLFDGSAAFMTSGITLALGDGPTAAAKRLWDEAEGQLRVLDVNYRSGLWGPAAAAEAIRPYLAQCDVLLIAERDARILFGTVDLRDYAARAVIALTRGAEGARAIAPDGEEAMAAALPLGSAGRIGRGDAFASGFLAGILRGMDLGSSLRLAVACASFKSTIPGDLARLERSVVETLAWRDPDSDVIR